MSRKRTLALLTSEAEVASRLDEQVSKFALIELYLQALAAQRGHCDDPCTWSEVLEDANPTLLLRGDRRLKGPA